MTLVRNQLPLYFRQSMEWVFIDEIDVEPLNSATSTYCLKDGDWFFRWHFPDNPIFPGVFQMEMLQQTGGMIINSSEGKTELPLYFYSSDNLVIHCAGYPGDMLESSVEMHSYRRGIAKFHGELYINGRCSCAMNFVLIAPSEMAAK